MSDDWSLGISISNINCSDRISRQLCVMIQPVMFDTIICQVVALLPEKIGQPSMNTKSGGVIEAHAESVGKSSLKVQQILSGCFKMFLN